MNVTNSIETNTPSSLVSQDFAQATQSREALQVSLRALSAGELSLVGGGTDITNMY